MPLNHCRAVIALIGALLLVAVSGDALSAAAQETEPDVVQLSIKPVNSPDSYFTVTGAPGEVVQLEVELANYGTSAIEVLTYPADAYSLVNGGFGVKLDGEPTSGATHWLDYPVETFELASETAVTRAFALTIPEDATPGEYLSALVIQNANPVGGENSGIGFKQVNRQAIAVAIEIPGELLPALDIGEMEHKVVAGRSVITAAVENTGNVHLKPEGEFVLVDSTGEEVLRKPVTMGSVYAGTATLLEVPFSEPLVAGEYLASLELADLLKQANARASQVAISVPEIEVPADTASSDEGSGSNVAVVDQQPEAAADPASGVDPAADEVSSSGTPVWVLGAGIALALIGCVGGCAGVLALARRRRGKAEPAAPEVVEEPDPTPAAKPDPVPVPAPAPVVTAVTPEPVRAAAPAQPRRLPVMRQLSVPGERTARRATNSPGSIGHSVGEPAGD